jgi:NTP pyrophosphatase (non-canonical NTP hydrolase)
MVLLESAQRGADPQPGRRLRVALCGTYRRDPVGLAQTFTELRQTFDVVSPTSVSFVDARAEFVRLPDELLSSEAEVEKRHLEAIDRADFVWLHSPDGYVGVSASMELGHANALGVPVFASSPPNDPVIAMTVTPVPSAREITWDSVRVEQRSGAGLNRLQQYYEEAARRRSWDEESVQQILELLEGEILELKTAIRKREANIKCDNDRDADVSGEMADVQLYVTHLASALGVELARAVTVKERANAIRFEDHMNL